MRLSALKKLIQAAPEPRSLADEGSFGGGFTQPAGHEVKFYKDRGRIYIDGRLLHTTPVVEAQEVFTLPETDLPAKDMWVPVIMIDIGTNLDMGGSIFIDSESGVTVLQGVGPDPTDNGVLLDFDGVNFRAA